MTLTRYQVLLACAPFPFQSSICVANDRKGAIAKAKAEAKRYGLKTRRVIEVVIH